MRGPLCRSCCPLVGIQPFCHLGQVRGPVMAFLMEARARRRAPEPTPANEPLELLSRPSRSRPMAVSGSIATLVARVPGRQVSPQERVGRRLCRFATPKSQGEATHTATSPSCSGHMTNPPRAPNAVHRTAMLPSHQSHHCGGSGPKSGGQGPWTPHEGQHGLRPQRHDSRGDPDLVQARAWSPTDREKASCDTCTHALQHILHFGAFWLQTID